MIRRLCTLVLVVQALSVQALSAQAALAQAKPLETAIERAADAAIEAAIPRADRPEANLLRLQLKRRP